MIKVIHIIPNLGTGGAEKLVTDICLNLNKDKFQVTIVSLYKNNDSIFIKNLENKNIEIVELDKKIGFDLSIIYKLYKVLKKYKPDVINTHLYVVPYLIIPALLKKIKVKVHTVHSIASKELSSKFKKIIMKISYTCCGFVPIGISDYVKKSILKEYRLKENNVECIYNGIDTNKFPLTNNYIHNNQIIFINVARLNEAKNQILLIEAFKLVKEKVNNTKLHIIGDGELRDKIEEKIIELDLKNDVILRGKREDINAELNKANVFVLSSNYEGLPLSVLEAMSCGLPIVSTNAGGVIDIVKNEINGLIVERNNKVELANAMIKMCDNKKLIKDMGTKSHELSEKYDIKKVANEYENLYLRLLQDRKEKNERRKRKN